MKIGYACLAVAVPGSALKSCTLKNASKEHLLSLIGHNLDSLENIIDYNIQNGIALFRISSGLIPFGSGAAADLPWQDRYAEKLAAIGKKIAGAGMRVSMHPGQYTVLNSPDTAVAERAVKDLAYHAKVLDGLGLGSEHKLVLHLGGVYGDKKQAQSRFLARCQELEVAVRKRLVLENDGVSYTIEDVLETASQAAIPVVYDNLHNATNPAKAGMIDVDWIRQCAATWKKGDGRQKIHYSEQHHSKKPGAHSDSINIERFLEFCGQLTGMDLDIMLEVKDKNISALKCINCVSRREFSRLETEWTRYSYSVLERSSDIYDSLRQMLRVNNGYPAREMYSLIEEALSLPVVAGNAVHAAQRVWGYFEDKASAAERKRFRQLLGNLHSGEACLKSLKNNLLRLAAKYRVDNLLSSYYFYKWQAAGLE